MRLLGLGFLLLLLARPAHAQWPDLDSSRVHHRAGLEAYRAGDDAAFLQHTETALALRPHHPGLAYNLAVAHARTGDAEAALAALARYAAFGLTADLDADDDLALLRAHPDFPTLAARLAANAAPLGHADTLWTGLDAGFFPEGAGHDARTGDLYLSSIARAQIVRIRAGRPEVFFDGAGGGLWSMTGLAVDGRRGRLWACTAAIAPGLHGDSTDVGRSALLALALTDGRLLARYDLPGADPRLCGDLHLAADGAIWLTDSLGGGVYRLAPGAPTLDTAWPPGTLPSPQGLTTAPDGALYVADYALGLVRLDPETGTLQRLPTPAGTTLLGIDGLYYHDGALIAIQNGVRPHRVLRLPLTGDGLGAPEVIARALPAFGEPTLGVLDGEALLVVANAAWPYLGRDGRVDAEAARPPVLLRLPLRP